MKNYGYLDTGEKIKAPAGSRILEIGEELTGDEFLVVYTDRILDDYGHWHPMKRVGWISYPARIGNVGHPETSMFLAVGVIEDEIIKAIWRICIASPKLIREGVWPEDIIKYYSNFD